MEGIERLERIRNLNKNPNYVNTDLYRLFYKEDLYVAAYEKIKSKLGNLTPGPDTETLDGFNINRVDSIIADMRSEAFQFKPFRRIYIPKPKTEKMRPLGLPSPVDKIVQEIMRNILEAIYEPVFLLYFGNKILDVSHGFRPNRSPATALKQLRKRSSLLFQSKALKEEVSKETFNPFFFLHFFVKKMLARNYRTRSKPINSLDSRKIHSAPNLSQLN